jgi:hypothetical protein
MANRGVLLQVHLGGPQIHQFRCIAEHHTDIGEETRAIDSLVRRITLKLDKALGIEPQWTLPTPPVGGVGRGGRRIIYLSRVLSETMMAVRRGRMVIFFGTGQKCLVHDCIIDDEHISNC